MLASPYSDRSVSIGSACVARYAGTRHDNASAATIPAHNPAYRTGPVARKCRYIDVRRVAASHRVEGHPRINPTAIPISDSTMAIPANIATVASRSLQLLQLDNRDRGRRRIAHVL